MRLCLPSGKTTRASCGCLILMAYFFVYHGWIFQVAEMLPPSCMVMIIHTVKQLKYQKTTRADI